MPGTIAIRAGCEHGGGEGGGPVSDFVEVAVLGVEVPAFLAVGAQAAGGRVVTEGREERFPMAGILVGDTMGVGGHGRDRAGGCPGNGLPESLEG